VIGLALACAAPRDLGGDVLVVVLDDIGVESIGAYGLRTDAPPTPRLDALAAEGVRFDRAYATPVCTPSRAALITGEYGRRYGLGNNLTDAGQLPTSVRTVADRARDAGYATGAFGKWHLLSGATPDGWVHPNALGFDRFDGNLLNLDSPYGQWVDGPGYYRWERVVDGEPAIEGRFAPDVAVDAATDWMADADEPWFAYVALQTAHGPLAPPPGSDLGPGATDEELYAALVRAADDEVGRLLDAAPTDATVIVVGDNGPSALNLPRDWDVLGHKGTVAEGGIRVPLLIAGPTVSAPGTTTDALVHAVDVAATVADLAGADLADPDLDGRSLVPLLHGGGWDREVLYDELFGPWGEDPPPTDLRVAVSAHDKLVVDGGEVRTFRVGDSPEDEVEAPLPAERVQALTAALADRERALDPAGCATSPGGGSALLVALLRVRRRRAHRDPGPGRGDAAAPVQPDLRHQRVPPSLRPGRSVLDPHLARQPVRREIDDRHGPGLPAVPQLVRVGVEPEPVPDLDRLLLGHPRRIELRAQRPLDRA
jgi:hypothetical protein